MTKLKLILTILTVSILVNIAFWGVYLLADFYDFWDIYKTTQVQEPSTTDWLDIEDIKDMDDLQQTLINTIQNTGQWVVSIVITQELEVYYQDPFDFFGGSLEKQRQEVGGGSWIVVSEKWYVITNKHVIQEARRWQTDYTVVTRDWFDYDVKNIWMDPVLDIAVLKIVDDNWNTPSNLKPVDLIWLDYEILIWQFAIAIWNALSEFQDSASFGIISWKWRQLEDVPQDSIYVWLYQTDAPINPGNSWGPLMDIWWNVFWINTAISAIWQWIGFSIPINQEFVDSTLQMVKEEWNIKRPFLWVQHMDLNNAIAMNKDLPVSKWVYIQDVVPNSAADKAWISSGDIILEIEWVEIWMWNTFLYHLFAYKPWQTIQFKILSQWEEKNIDVTLEER